jgi:hypothetical protein
MNHILAAGAFMKVIYVLCDHSQLWQILGQFGDSAMRPVWLRLDNLVPAPFVPSPTQ